MRRVLAGVLALGLLAGAASAKQGWKNLVGKPCPSFDVTTWLNTEGAKPQPADLVGKVWLLELSSGG